MDPVFLGKLLISFFVGALWTIVVTLIADRLGSKIGGLVAGLPSMLFVGLLFVVWTENINAAIESTTIVPIAFGVTTIFLDSYIVLLNKNLWQALGSSLIIWFILTAILVVTNFNNFYFSIFIYIIILILSYIFVEKILKVPSQKGEKIIYTPQIILVRGLFSGLVVTCIVILTKISGPTIGGIMSAFPAMFSSTIVITYLSQGPLFSKAIAKSALFSTVTTALYAVIIRYTYGSIGVFYGTLLGLAISYISGYIIYEFLTKRLR